MPIKECDYLIDLDFPKHPSSSPLEPRYSVDEKTWERVSCKPFIDAKHSFVFTRAFWLPGQAWQRYNEFGDYCLLKNKALVAAKEVDVAQSIRQGDILV